MQLLSDIAAVEYRVAQLSDVERPPATANLIPSSFGALLAASAAPAAADPRSAPQPSPVPSVKLERIIARACAGNGIDPALVKAVVANESGFDAAARSSAGAQGLMQLMPATAESVGVGDPYDPQQNVSGGTNYLRGLLRRFGGNVPLALAGYNAGPGAVERGAIGTGTKDYVRSVLTSYAAYRNTGRRS